MDDKTKDLYIEKVEKYEDLSKEWQLIVLESIILSMVASSVILYNKTEVFCNVPLIGLFIGWGIVTVQAIYFLVGAVYEMAEKNARIEEIKEFFTHHGLVLEDEVAKGRSK